MEMYIFDSINEQSLSDIRRICYGMVLSESRRIRVFKCSEYVWEFGMEVANHIRLLFKRFPLSLMDITCVVKDTMPVDQIRLRRINQHIYDKDESSMCPSTMKTMKLDAPSLYPEYMTAKRMAEIEKCKIKKRYELMIKNVIFNDPATIVYWFDGTKTVVKAEGEAFDPEKGLAMAIAKKIFGNEGNYYDIFRKWLPKEETIYMSVKEFAALAGVSESTIRTQLRKGQYPYAKKVNGKWQIPYNTDKPEEVDYE